MKIIAQKEVQWCADSGKTLHGRNCCTTAIGGTGEEFYDIWKNVSCEYDRLNCWNSTLQAAWYIKHVRRTCLFYISFIIWCLWTKPTMWLLILSFTYFTEGRRACSIFYPRERYRSVTDLRGTYVFFLGVGQCKQRSIPTMLHAERCSTWKHCIQHRCTTVRTRRQLWIQYSALHEKYGS